MFLFQSLDFMAGICNPAHIGERKMLCHSFGKAVDLLLAVCMLVQEVADMLFHLVISVLDFFWEATNGDCLLWQRKSLFLVSILDN